MSQEGENLGRRRFLLASMAGVGGVGAVGAAVPFVASWSPSERAKAAGGPAKIDISKIEAGRLVTGEWRGKPIYVVKRTQEMVDLLSSADVKDRLKDKDSDNAAQQPEFAKNDHRSREPDLLVLEGVCTHLGCAPKLVPEVKPQAYDENWKGGFFCPCHGSRFDMAGRVYSGSPANDNLKVPPYVVNGNQLIVGQEA